MDGKTNPVQMNGKKVQIKHKFWGADPGNQLEARNEYLGKVIGGIEDAVVGKGMSECFVPYIRNGAFAVGL